MFKWRHGAERNAMESGPVEERSMKFLVYLGWSLMVAAVSMPAAAAPGDSNGNAGFSVQVPSPQPLAPRETDRPARQLGSGEVERSSMSVDERRQLRRDIENAGREIYRNPAQGRRGGGRSGRR
jgi:hypothetical protein